MHSFNIWLLMSFYIILCNNDLVNCKAKLDMWDQTSYARRAENVKQRLVRTPKANLTEETSHKHNDSIANANTTINDARKRVQKPDGTKDSSWPKVRSAKKKAKELQRVTKIDKYLRQVDDDGNETQNAKKKDTEVGSEEDETIIISPYSVKLQMEKLCNNFPKANITIEVLDRTMEYNEIVLLKITKNLDSMRFRADDDKYIVDEVPEKKIVFIVHGLSLLGYKNIPGLYKAASKHLIGFYLEHLDQFDIFLVPMANPDGIAMLPTKPAWNKNMSPQDSCPGVALDRNFDIGWNVSKTTSSCSQQYAGKEPFSEPETRAIRSVFHRYSHKIIAYFHVHAGTLTPHTFKGDAVLYPKGYTDAQADEDKYIDLRADIDEAMKNANFRSISVTVDTLHSWYGKVSGTSVDYASTIYGIPYALELVMQAYTESSLFGDTNLSLATHALNHIWKRVISVIFNNIHKLMNSNNEANK